MVRIFTRDDVLRLAPDASSAKSGQELAQPRKWTDLGGDETAIWGECPGSGAKPYQVQVELAEPAFKCSCPSRKFPCKHGLGLLLLLATDPEAIAPAQRPAWVDEWLASREAREAKAAQKQAREPQPRDANAQAKRRAKRLERIRAGMSDLAAWMRELVRGGIGGVPGKGFDFFDSQARRMVDAQAPGVARLVQQLGSLAFSGAGWQRRFLEQLALLHLVAQAVERFEQLPESLRADVESVLGIPTAADELDDLPGTTDCWQVLAQEVELEDRLRVQRTWLYGVHSRRAAMVLQFAHGALALSSGLPVGTRFEGELVYFPGSGLRASVRSTRIDFEPLASVDGCRRAQEVLERYSEAIAACPWIDRLGLPLCGVTPAMDGQNWWIVDAVGDAIGMRMRGDEGFTLLAISGGHPVDLAAEYDGRVLRPLAVADGGRWTSFAPAVPEVAAR